ncbi:protein PHYTOCHROME KINASE SUBSTRATE 4-like [Magnolia sinica]|uniref:protein PHYTOCHROME KINASE SUBSTRATE 4-like n=1 Tax=Magnolia sinica TaxID=86752 RepID=UPI0026597420|nr:protein PHYTOCHROME KINASE SUBSTRATE 4-like [Magnolia sinica]
MTHLVNHCYHAGVCAVLSLHCTAIADDSFFFSSFNGSLGQRSTFQTTDISLPYTRFQSKPNFRDNSFSSQICPDTATTVAKPSLKPAVGNRADDTEINIFDAKQYFDEDPDQKQIKTSQPLDHIAERCDLSTAPHLSSVSSVDGFGRNCRSGSFHATPTASSEASWNSQSGLLSNPSGSISISMKNLPLNGQ